MKQFIRFDFTDNKNKIWWKIKQQKKNTQIILLWSATYIENNRSVDVRRCGQLQRLQAADWEEEKLTKWTVKKEKEKKLFMKCS